MEGETYNQYVAEKMHEVCEHLFMWKPLNAPIIDNYNSLIEDSLYQILSSPKYVRTSKTIQKLSFRNILRVPPMQGNLHIDLNDIIQKIRNENEDFGEEKIDKLIIEKTKAFFSDLPNIDGKTNSRMLPRDARLQNKSYVLSVYGDLIQEIWDIENEDDLELEKSSDHQKTFEVVERALSHKVETSFVSYEYNSIKIFEIPLMQGSSYDWMILARTPPENYSFYGECDLDPLCNFIIRGNSKVFVNQLKLLPNTASCVEKSAIGRQIEIKSTTTRKDSHNFKMQFTSSVNTKGLNNICNIMLPYISKKTKNQGDSTTKPPKYKFNVFWLWRLYVLYDAMKTETTDPNNGPFGFEDGLTTKRTLDDFNKHLKQATKGNQKVYNNVVNHLGNTIRYFVNEEKTPQNDEKFVAHIADLLKQEANDFHFVTLSNIVEILDRQFLPHIEDNEYEYFKDSDAEDWIPDRKFLTLTYIIIKFVKFQNGARPVDDLNHMGIQQIATVGIELGFLIRKGFKNIMFDIQNAIETNSNKAKERNTAIKNAVETKGDLFSKDLIQIFATGKWGLKENSKKREGVVQQHAMGSIVSKWNMVRKCIVPIRKESKIAKPRMVHQSSYGLIDPTSTPDSAQVGLVKQLAVSAYITTEDREITNLIMNFVNDALEGTVEVARDIRGNVSRIIDEDINIPIMFNFTFMGFCDMEFVNYIKSLKRKRHYYIEAYIKIEIDDWEEIKEFHIRTGEGRAIRPLFIVNEDQSIPFLELLKTKPEASKDFALLLREGCIEYLSASEFEFTETAMTFKEFLKGRVKGRKYTHMELDPYMSMSVEVALQPFAGLNPNPRTMYFASMVKQAISIPHTTFMQRFDTDTKVLNYPHKPLIRTQMTGILGLTEQPFGNMVIVAIKSQMGTDEDATAWKKSFFERGGLTGTLYETYKVESTETIPDESDDKTLFSNGVIKLKKDFEEGEEPEPQGKVSFAKLSGKSSVEVSPGDLLLRYKTTVAQKTEVKKERLEGHRSGYINNHHSDDGVEMVSVRFPHVPYYGDKFANVYAQKGVAGSIVNDEDMPFSADTGVTPDVIFSPTSFASRMTTGMPADILIGGAFVAPDRRRLVKNMVKFTDFDVKPLIVEDFWIALQRYALSKEDENVYQRLNSLRDDLRREFRNSTEEDIDFEVGKHWNVVDALLITKSIYAEDLIIPQVEYVSKMSTGEKVILFSQLPPSLQIKYYEMRSEDLVPNYMLKNPKSLTDKTILDATAFREPRYEDAEKILMEKGWNYHGEQTMIDGKTGIENKMKIFMGPTYRMQLPHLTESKYQTRDKGVVSAVTRGATSGKSAGGAVRNGELTHTALFAHDALDFLEERFKNTADKFDLLSCQDCGDTCYIASGIVKSKCDSCGSEKLPLQVSVPWAGMRFIAYLTATGQKVLYDVALHPDFVQNSEEFPDIGSKFNPRID